MAPSWDSAYGLFVKGEAPLVWSYTTSQAYHRAQGETAYRAIVLEEGAPLQVEGAVMMKGIQGETRKLAESFLEFLISPAVQERVATAQWMYPSVKGTVLPASYSGISRPSKVIHLRKSREDVQAALVRFSALSK